MTRSPAITFDGSPVEHLTFPRPPITKTAPRTRPLTRARTLACTACELRGSCRAPVAPTFPPAMTSSFAVIGEAPGQLEDRKGQVFVGKSGQVLRKLMREVGLDVDAGAWMNVNACRPPDNRTPEVDERMACRPNLLAALTAANTRYVLLCGATAVSAWQGDVKVTKARGNWFIWWTGEGDGRRGWWVMPTLHPAAVLRHGGLKGDLREDLEKFARVVNGETRAQYGVSTTCVECGEPWTRWEDDGVAWCEKCWEKKAKAARKGVRRGKVRVHRDQERLEL